MFYGGGNIIKLDQYFPKWMVSPTPQCAFTFTLKSVKHTSKNFHNRLPVTGIQPTIFSITNFQITSLDSKFAKVMIP